MTDQPPVRAAVRRALAEHQPAGKKYNDDGSITKHCRCGQDTDAATLTPRTQHLEDVVVAALEPGPAAPLPTRDEVLYVARAAAVGVRKHRIAGAVIDALQGLGMLAWREES